MPADDLLELGGEGLTALLDTGHGDRALTRVANTHWHRDPASHSRSRSRRDSVNGTHERDGARKRHRSNEKDTPDEKWSIKTFWKGSGHQRKPRKPAPESGSSPRKSKEKPREKASNIGYEQEAPAAELAHQQKRERFRDSKASYVPLETTRSVDEMRFEQDRLYADVGKAVRDATRRSENALRNK